MDLRLNVVCRLCFTTRNPYKEIFGGENTQLNIAKIIEQHFQCEINESDPLPKIICIECWSKTETFHEFHQSVLCAQQNFLKDLVKDEIDIDEDATTVNQWKGKDDLIGATENMFELIEPNFVECKTELDDISNGLDISNRRIASLRPKKSKLTKQSMESQGIINEFFDMTCDVCQTSVRSLEDARLHYKEVHKIRKGYVKCCKLKLKEHSQVDDHIKWHLNPEMFRCKICHKIKETRKSLYKHTLYHTKRFGCDICSKCYSTKGKVKRHIMSVHVKPERTFQCEFCDKRFPFNDNLKMHIKIKHSTDSPRICEVCAKMFKSEVALRAHMRTHAPKVPEPRIQCTICGSWLCDRYRLKAHMLIHTSAPQKCNICGKFSTTPQALKLHIKAIHTERTHKCHLCEKAFKNDIVLRGHIATHTGERPYRCSFCPILFIWRQDKYNHQKKAHPTEWSESKAKKTF